MNLIQRLQRMFAGMILLGLFALVPYPAYAHGVTPLLEGV